MSTTARQGRKDNASKRNAVGRSGTPVGVKHQYLPEGRQVSNDCIQGTKTRVVEDWEGTKDTNKAKVSDSSLNSTLLPGDTNCIVITAL